jgi:hypothetical protein
MEAIAADPPAPWVRSLYMAKFRNYLRSWYSQSDREAPRIASLLGQLPEGPALAEEMAREGHLGDSLKRHLERSVPKRKLPDPPRSVAGAAP